jgi:hypothetical protein
MRPPWRRTVLVQATGEAAPAGQQSSRRRSERVKDERGGGLAGNQFFLIGILIGSAAGLALGSALGFELRPDNIRALRKMLRRLMGHEDRPHYDLMV